MIQIDPLFAGKVPYYSGMSRPTAECIRLLPNTVSGSLTGMLYAVLTLQGDVPTSPPKVLRRGFYLQSGPIQDGGQPFTIMASDLPL